MIRLIDDRSFEAGMDGLYWLKAPARLDLPSPCSTAVALRLMVRERVLPLSGGEAEARGVHPAGPGVGA